MGYSLGQEATSTKEISFKNLGTDMERCIGQMEPSTKAIGRMEFNMGMGRSLRLSVLLPSEAFSKTTSS